MEEILPTEALAKFKPESCVFVISINGDGKPNGMIAGWNMRCSNDPPLLAVALSKRGYTHKLIRESKEFVIAVPNKELEDELMFFGTHHGDKFDKFKETGIETVKGKVVNSPLLKKATINFECQLEKEVDVGDHLLFIGKVVAAYYDKSKKVLIYMRKREGKRVLEEF